MERLPQAHERIIGERQVKNTEKMLSLYEEQAAVYVRRKAASGVIVDWELVNGHRTPDAKQADTKMLGRSLERMNGTSRGPAIRQVCGDRGFDSASNREPALLEKARIYNAICPKSPAKLDKRMKDPAFAKLQKRRS